MDTKNTTAGSGLNEIGVLADVGDLLLSTSTTLHERSTHEPPPSDLEQQLRELEDRQADHHAQITVLLALSSSALRALSGKQRDKAKAEFESQCEALTAAMLGTAGPDVDRQLEQVALMREVLAPSFEAD
ncbi:hypothetical protein [Burkholderia stagnalis]|uniref:hypothetical protein n=1 Tax=Burkholderia stagnalis TaxID=1503054 RepID=UPI0012D91081|nr:hypothetical protein [Burkholderia stagnalis]